MGNMIGSDPEQLDALGQRMSGSADRLDVIRGEVTTLLAHSRWDGVDADNFRHQWHYRLSGLVHAVADSTRSQAASLHANANQQRQASAASGGSGGGFSFGGGGSPSGYGNPVLDYLDQLLTTWDNTTALTLLDIAGIGPQIIALMTKNKALNLANPTLLDKIGVLDVGKAFPKLTKFGTVAEVAGKALNWLGLAKDSIELGKNISMTGWTSGDTFVKGVDVVLDAATILTVEVPPAALVVAVGHIGFDLAADYFKDHPEAGKAVIDAAGTAAKTVADAAGTVAGGVEHAASDFISDGISKISHFLGG